VVNSKKCKKQARVKEIIRTKKVGKKINVGRNENSIQVLPAVVLAKKTCNSFFFSPALLLINDDTQGSEKSFSLHHCVICDPIYY
jgi:hypothetical protein